MSAPEVDDGGGGDGTEAPASSPVEPPLEGMAPPAPVPRKPPRRGPKVSVSIPLGP